MWNETIGNDDIFLAQHSIATVTLFRMVTALQRCVVLKIVVANRPVQHHL